MLLMKKYACLTCWSINIKSKPCLSDVNVVNFAVGIFTEYIKKQVFESTMVLNLALTVKLR